jgi:hypothetical protein
MNGNYLHDVELSIWFPFVENCLIPLTFLDIKEIMRWKKKYILNPVLNNYFVSFWELMFGNLQ